MKLQLHTKIFERAEAAPTLDDALAILRELPLAHFGWLLWSMPDPAFPRLSAMLPRMASVEDQNLWTGENGYILLKKSVSFAHVVGQEFHRITGRALNGQRMLDYGSGWGRFLRLMAYYTAPGNIQGVDPWDRSIAVCQENGVWGSCRQSEYLPETLPADNDVDLAFAFSVFTHTSEPATRAALNAVRKTMKPGGVFAFTFRPIEYWDMAGAYVPNLPAERLKAEHAASGFAFEPHPGLEHYGDTSMSLEWIADAAEGWEVISHGVSIEDPYQLISYLRAA